MLPPLDPKTSYSNFPGIVTTVSPCDLNEYIETRAAQMSALSSVLCMEGFSYLDPKIRENTIWLANSLSEELCSLLQIAAHRRATPE